MDKDLEKIETRSKKVREIMQEPPPIAIRYGTTIIVLLLLSIAIIVIYILM